MNRVTGLIELRRAARSLADQGVNATVTSNDELLVFGVAVARLTDSRLIYSKWLIGPGDLASRVVKSLDGSLGSYLTMQADLAKWAKVVTDELVDMTRDVRLSTVAGAEQFIKTAEWRKIKRAYYNEDSWLTVRATTDVLRHLRAFARWRKKIRRKERLKEKERG